MKSLLTSILICLAFLTYAQEADRFIESNNEQPSDPRMDQMSFVPNEVLVKFKDEITINSGTELKSAGVTSIDKLLRANGVSSMEKLFTQETRLKAARIIKDPQGRDMKIPSLHNIYKITIPQLKSTGGNPTDIFKFIEEMKALPEVEYVEPNYIYSIGDFTPAGPEMSMLEAMAKPENDELSQSATGLVPNDPLYNQQWGIPACNIDDVWNQTTGDSTSIIAILDTGVDWLHPDLSANIWKNKDEIAGNGMDDDGNGLVDDIRGWDYINNDNDPKDDNSHGTHVAGIAAAVGNNGKGIAGVNWRAKIMPIKVFQSSGRGDAATIAKGITYAAQKGAMVINMSFGSYAESLTMKNALASAYATSVLVAAAGNDGLCIGPGLCPDRRIGIPMYPGGYSFVLGVEANTTGSRAGFSNFDQDGPVFSGYTDLLNYELKAPGTGILSAVPGGNYREYNGTSMAAPLVAGAVSLYRKQKPGESQELLFGNFINSISQHIDLEGALNIIPEPRLDIVSYEIADTIDGDRDGRPDAGETIELKVKVRNTWGQANDVKVGIEFGEFEDQASATILTNEATVGSVSTYATKENILPLKIKISYSNANNRDISFVLKTWSENKTTKKSLPVVLAIQNGVNLQGMIYGKTHLSINKTYTVTDNAVFDTLIIDPGVILKFNSEKSITIMKFLQAVGKPDSLIFFSNNESNYWGKIQYLGANSTKFKYCVFESGGPGYPNNIINIPAENCIFRNNRTPLFFNGQPPIIKSSFESNTKLNNSLIFRCLGSPLINNNFLNNNRIDLSAAGYSTFDQILNNAFINAGINFGFELSTGNVFKTYILPTNYWGTIDKTKIEKSLLDYFEDPNLPILSGFLNKLSKPSKLNHGLVWKVLVNGKDAQDEFDQLEPLGVAKQKFEVYFNRAMDIKYPPTVSMGVRYPFTQTAISEQGTWSADSTIYTVYGNVGLNTGDGINTIRVTGAKDMDHFEIPIEDRRFKVIVNAAGSASSEFQATAGLGKVNLEWNNNDLADGLGYNMYRMEQISPTELSKPKLINSMLIADTLYTDYDVTPNKKYYYYYKILRTNLSETDSSKIVATTPLTASKGDANGDLTVNILDVTTIVASLMNQNPQPFIAEAADVNGDGNINVLDVVGVVNVVLGYKSAVIASTEKINLYMQNDTLFADIPVSIGGIQMDITGTTKMDEITILNVLKGFESAYSVKDNSLRLLFYSLSGKTIETGKRVPLLKLQKRTGITNIVFGDKSGSAIEVEMLSTGVWNLSDNLKSVAELGQNYPNPLVDQTTIPVHIYEPVDEVIIRIVDIFGQTIETIRLTYPQTGEHLIQFKTVTRKGLMAYSLEIRRGLKSHMGEVKKMIVN
jgi:subtilisin family serine protease